MQNRVAAIPALSLSVILAGPVFGDVIYNNLTPNNLVAIATRPDSSSGFEIEAGDDFLLTQPTSITSASFVGLEVPGATVQDLVVEVYRVFPKDSDTARTSGPPTFSTAQVPTRVNSPSDVAFESKDSAASELSFTQSILDPSFTVLNSVQPGGIHPQPNNLTGGNGPLTGQEVEFDVTFNTPFTLPADHYFFVPQVLLSNGQFYWLSASRPISGSGTTPFPAGFTDLQAWTRDANLDPDWLRVGTDIVGGTTFNTAFSLNGNAVPEPVSTVGVVIGLAFIGYRRWRSRFAK
jgi:hypothetical protein